MAQPIFVYGRTRFIRVCEHERFRTWLQLRHPDIQVNVHLSNPEAIITLSTLVPWSHNGDPASVIDAILKGGFVNRVPEDNRQVILVESLYAISPDAPLVQHVHAFNTIGDRISTSSKSECAQTSRFDSAAMELLLNMGGNPDNAGSVEMLLTKANEIIHRQWFNMRQHSVA